MPDSPSLTIAEALQAGFEHHLAGRLPEAEALYLKVLEADPANANALHLLGAIGMQVGKPDIALSLFDRALGSDPGLAEAWNNRGNVLRLLGRFDESLESCRRALAIRPDFAEAHNNLAIALVALKRPGAALESFERALAANPRLVETWNNLGNVLQELERPAEALASHDKALALQPEYADAWANRGNALRALGRYAEAVASFDRALSIRPGDAQAHNNRGNALQELNRCDEALASYARALELAPTRAEARFDASLCRLSMGDFERGWPEYEWRWKTEGMKGHLRDFPWPKWEGTEPLGGKTLLLHAEQGLGDAIQFCRYVPMVAARGARVVLEVQAALQPLLARLPGVHALVAPGDPVPPCDFHCPLLSLPLAFGTRVETIPAEIPYLHAEPDLVEAWRQRLGPKSGPRIGIAWSANPALAYGRARSLSLAELADLVPAGAQAYSLQKDLTDPERALVESRPGLRHFGTGFADTAALVALMDVVVTVDTSIAHLAGAMGRPVWILMRFRGDWRWLLDREDSPWYPTARLFRQKAPGDWDGVFRAVREALEGLGRG